MAEEDASSAVYIDTNVFCAAIEGDDEKSSQELRSLFASLKTKPKKAVTSELTLAELLGRESPFLDWTSLKRVYVDMLVSGGFIDLLPISRDILFETADYPRKARQEGKSVKLPDAIHVVTAIKAGCRYVLTADKRFPIPDPMSRIPFDPAEIASLTKLLDA